MSPEEYWRITVDTPVGQQSGSLALSLGDTVCSGRLFSEAGELTLQNGIVQENELRWQLQLSRPIPMTIECLAQITGNRIKGTATVAAFGDITFTGTRVEGSSICTEG